MNRQRLASLLIVLLVSLLLPASVAAAPPVANPDTPPPIAEDDLATLIDVLVNDDVGDNGPLTIQGVASPPANGTVVIAMDDMTLTYQPNADYNGPDTFDYIATDGVDSATATVTIAITAVDDPPDAVDDIVTDVTEDTPTVIDVLGNDTDIDTPHASLNVVPVVTTPTHGDVTIASNGSDVTYTPDSNYNGSDSFSYTVSDGSSTDTATVDVTITAVNDLPTAGGDSFTIDEDVTTDFDVLADDSDPDGTDPTISDPGNPTHGTTSVVGGEIRYDPDPNYHGSDDFMYTITDGSLTATATVNVTLTSINDDPVADNDDFGVAEEAPATAVLVLAGDIDVDGDPLDITAKTNGTKGVVVITGGGTGLTYKPNANAFGADSFTYTISDGNGGTDTATVTVDIGGANDPPNAVNDPSMTVPQGAGPMTLTVLANDSDPDGDTLTITAKTNGAHGTVTITGSGTGLTYNPSGIYKGTDTFKYTVSDGQGGTDQATVVVTVARDVIDPVTIAPSQAFFYQTVGTTTTKVRLTWGATDTGGTGVASYKLQVSVNGGSYSTITASTTKTSWDRTLTTGKSYRFRVRATDKEGNASSYAYGPTITPTRYSEQSARITYVGSWPRTTSSQALGGHARNATTSTKRAVFTFTGYDVGWIATRVTSSGKAQVFVDGVLIKTVDLDRSSTSYRRLMFSRHFATLAPHTLEIRPVGDGRVDIDGFVVDR